MESANHLHALRVLNDFLLRQYLVDTKKKHENIWKIFVREGQNHLVLFDNKHNFRNISMDLRSSRAFLA